MIYAVTPYGAPSERKPSTVNLNKDVSINPKMDGADGGGGGGEDSTHLCSVNSRIYILLILQAFMIVLPIDASFDTIFFFEFDQQVPRSITNCGQNDNSLICFVHNAELSIHGYVNSNYLSIIQSNLGHRYETPWAYPL